MRTEKKIHPLGYLALLLVMLCIVDNSIAQHEHAVRNVKVRVQLIQGTKDGDNVPSLPVELNVYEHGEHIQRLESISDANGIAVFSDVSLGQHRIARAGTRYKNMYFSSLPFELIPSHIQASTNIMVYEVSYDNSPLKIEMSHIIIELIEEGIKITEIAELSNTTDRAISARKSEQDNLSRVLYIEPFNGFEEIEFTRYFVKDAVLTTEKGFYDTMAMPPGSHQSVYSYILPIRSETRDMLKKSTLPIGELIIFSKIGLGKILGIGKPSGSMVSEEGIDCEYFSLSNIKPGDTIEFKAVDLNFRKSNKKQIIIMAVVFVLMAAVVGFRIIKNSLKDSA